MDVEAVIGATGQMMEVVGIAVIVIGACVAMRPLIGRSRPPDSVRDAYAQYRRGLARSIILGLDFLVAGDIIRTVAVGPGFGALGVLAGIVLIRTFLSVVLEVEVNRRWPWQQR